MNKQRVSVRLRSDQVAYLGQLSDSTVDAVESVIGIAGDPPIEVLNPGLLVPVSVRLSEDARRKLQAWTLAYGSTSRAVRAMIDAVRRSNRGGGRGGGDRHE